MHRSGHQPLSAARAARPPRRPPIQVDVLTDAEAHTLLTAALGGTQTDDSGVAADRAVGDLITLCQGFPLQLVGRWSLDVQGRGADRCLGVGVADLKLGRRTDDPTSRLWRRSPRPCACRGTDALPQSPPAKTFASLVLLRPEFPSESVRSDRFRYILDE